MSSVVTTSLTNALACQPIIFVGGKGGVGKTTTAAALASRFSTKGHKTLIISTDPAHSLGDVLNTQLSNELTIINENLHAIELNPDEIVDKHFAQVEQTIKGYTSPEMMPKIREHLASSKSAPGAQEAAMLEAMCQHLVDAESKGYEHIIFDTAPTGHTLRLLVLPEMMSAWTDGLLSQQRRQAKLKSVANHLTVKKVNQSEVDNKSDDKEKTKFANPFKQHIPDRWEQAVDALEKRKQLFKKVGQLLHDKDKTAIVLVMIADTLPIAETKRAVSQLETSKIPVKAIVVNQLINEQQTDLFWQNRASRQKSLMDEITKVFSSYPLYPIYLQQTDIRGSVELEQLVR